MVTATPEQILEHLTVRQHVMPHRPLGEALNELCQQVGTCPVAVNRAADWLEFPSDLSFGRLRRSELVQLSRSIHRFWRAAAARESTATA